MDLDLNSEQVRNFGGDTPFLPWGDGFYVVLPKSLAHKNGNNGPAWIFTFAVIETDRADVKPGLDYCIYMPVSTIEQKGYAAQKLRAICAAVDNAKPSDPAYDANAAMRRFATDGFGDVAIDILCKDATTKNGKTVTRQTFQHHAF